MATKKLTDYTPDGTLVGQDANEKIGFYGATPIAQRTNAAQAAAGTTNATTASPWGYATSTQANGISALLNEIRTALVNLGLIKGS